MPILNIQLIFSDTSIIFPLYVENLNIYDEKDQSIENFMRYLLVFSNVD